MSKSDRPLQVDIPQPSDERPAWSRVGVIAVVGFAVGILWPRFAGIRVGPSVPGERAAAEASARAAAAPPTGSAPAMAPSGVPSASASAALSAAPAAPAANAETVVIGPSKTTKCSDKKDKKVDDCDKLAFDAIASQKLKVLATCPSALGLDGRMTIGFEFYFDKKDVKVDRVKKGSTFPSSTVNGIVKCAHAEFKGLSIEDIPHKHRRYTVQVPLTFYPPGKHPEGEGTDEAEKSGKDEKSDTSGTGTVAWDTAILRKEPRDGETLARLVRGTRVKIQSKQGDWYKVEASGKVGWVIRGALGM